MVIILVLTVGNQIRAKGIFNIKWTVKGRERQLAIMI